MRAVEGLRVLDVARFVAGGICCRILGNHGVDVVKVEKADGEAARRMPHLVKGESLYDVA